jgi:hypothetical protein
MSESIQTELILVEYNTMTGSIERPIRSTSWITESTVLTPPPHKIQYKTLQTSHASKPGMTSSLQRPRPIDTQTHSDDVDTKPVYHQSSNHPVLTITIIPP